MKQRMFELFGQDLCQFITNNEVSRSNRKIKDFKVQIAINNSLDVTLADTGANNSICGMKEAK